MTWRSFVAVGDSFTEGLDDPHPETGVFRGWADLVADRLATMPAVGTTAPEAGFGYANLAIRGRLFDNIVDQQVPPALRMRPDLISFAAGGNDALRHGFEPEKLIARFDHVVGTLRGSGADVIVFRFADVTGRLPGQRVILPRVTALNRSVGEIAEKRDATLVDLWTDDEFHNPALWSVDRLHMNAFGHQRVAAHVLSALGIEPDVTWLAAPPYPPRPSRPWRDRPRRSSSHRAFRPRLLRRHRHPSRHSRSTGR